MSKSRKKASKSGNAVASDMLPQDVEVDERLAELGQLGPQFVTIDANYMDLPSITQACPICGAAIARKVKGESITQLTTNLCEHTLAVFHTEADWAVVSRHSAFAHGLSAQEMRKLDTFSPKWRNTQELLTEIADVLWRKEHPEAEGFTLQDAQWLKLYRSLNNNVVAFTYYEEVTGHAGSIDACTVVLVQYPIALVDRDNVPTLGSWMDKHPNLSKCGEYGDQ